MERILVVEDDSEIRNGIKDLLEVEGFEVIEAEDGYNALESLKTEKVDMIISDIMMPNKNGYDLLTELQKDEQLSSIPFLFLTAKTSYEDYRKGMGLGVDDYIMKPFKADELLQAIKIRLKKKVEMDYKFENLKSGIIKYVPHELRTPLVSIIGFSDLIMDDYTEGMPEEVYEMIHRINVAGSRLLRTVEKFLIFTELKAFENNSQKKITDPENNFSVLKAVDDVHTKLYKIYNSKVEFDYQLVEEKLKIPEKYFQIILTELLDNAIKFSNPYDTVKIQTVSEDDYYSIDITNRGKEFTPEQIKKNSEFVQFDREEFQQSGNGLGLQIVKSIINIFGGSLQIDSKNRSTRITVKLLK